MDTSDPPPGPQAGPALQAALVRAVLAAALAEADRPVRRAVLGAVLAGVELGGPGGPRAGLASRTVGAPGAPGLPATPGMPASAHALAGGLAGACAAPGPAGPGQPQGLPAEGADAAALGLAAALALLPVPGKARPGKGQELLLAAGRGRRVAVVGHFPFVERLGGAFAALSVLELRPRPGDLPAALAARVLPGADVVAITGSALHNGTLGGLLALCRPEARVVLLGPSVPLVPALLELGVDALAGAVVRDADAALDGAARGLPLRRLAGVEPVFLARRDFFDLSS